LAEQAEAMSAAQAEEVAAYQERTEDLEHAVGWLEEQLAAALAAQPAVATSTAPGRKDQVLALMITGKHWKISDLAKAVGINERNISSQLTYLRKAGHAIATDSLGRKFIEV
jgi:predicted Rossmann fold nucleotide-binding protein DprA/Smf involved in DNA uptake